MVWHWRGSAAGPGERRRSSSPHGKHWDAKEVDREFDEALEGLRRQVNTKGSGATGPCVVPLTDEAEQEWRRLWVVAEADAEQRRERLRMIAKAILDDSLDPSKPSGAAGDTTDSDEGVGMGEEEKVAQNGDTETRGGGWRAVVLFSCPHRTSETPGCPICDSEKPCTPPAPPPSADPAEETSSGGKSCAEDAAEGALPQPGDFFRHVRSKDLYVARRSSSGEGLVLHPYWRTREGLESVEERRHEGEEHCCKPMKNWTSIWGPLVVAGSDVDGIGPPKFCLWCTTPLREDGELRVGSKAATKMSEPRENGDTLEESEG